MKALDQVHPETLTGLHPITQKSILKMQEISHEKDHIINVHSLDQIQFRDFINGWIHAIKTPISASKMLLESLPYDLTHQKLHQEIENINYYINQTLFYARLENFSDDYHIMQHSIVQIFNYSLKPFKSSFFLKSLRIEIKMDDINILTDDKWLQFVCSQLLSNAIKYADVNSKITISSEDQGNFYFLKIHNQGPKISPSDIKRLFIRGYTGSKDRIQNTATGMGLYLAKKCCDKLGHGLVIESDSNGTTAILKFEKMPEYHQTSIFRA